MSQIVLFTLPLNILSTTDPQVRFIEITTKYSYLYLSLVLIVPPVSTHDWAPGRSSPGLNSTSTGELELDLGPDHTAASQPQGRERGEGRGGPQVT